MMKENEIQKLEMDTLEKIKGAKVIQVIEVISLEGNGTEEDPFALKTSYFDLNGKLLATSSAPSQEKNNRR